MEQIVVVESSKPFDEACRALEQAIAQHGFGILHVHDIGQTLAKKGVAFDRDVRVFDVCHPQRAKQVLDENLLISAALPCAISVFAEGGRTKLAFVRPTAMLGLFGSERLQQVAREVEDTVRRIVAAAA
ncbi:MAG: DUF302 domain-containing protein [Thermodesulfobacteriota bacterium]